MADNRAKTATGGPEDAAYPGATSDPNPGERAEGDRAQNTTYYAMGIDPPTGNRVGGGSEIDVGARVGIMRNLEFSAGGRAHRVITGTYSGNRPTLDPKTRQIHTSTASDSGEPSVGGKSNEAGKEAVASRVEGAGATIDTSEGDVSPDRRRDKRTP